MPADVNVPQASACWRAQVCRECLETAVALSGEHGGAGGAGLVILPHDLDADEAVRHCAARRYGIAIDHVVIDGDLLEEAGPLCDVHGVGGGVVAWCFAMEPLAET